MIFYGGRVTLLPVQSLFYNDEINKFKVLTDILSTRIEFSAKKNVIIIVEPVLNEYGQLIGGKIGRESVRSLPLSKKLDKVTTVTYPYILFLVFPDEQIFLFQRNRDVFSDDTVVFKYLTGYLNKKLISRGLELDIKPLTTKGVFWQLVSELDKVYSVNIKLKVPNFLGKSYKDLKEVLDMEKKEANANEVEYGLKNDAGQLKLTNKQKYVSAVSWVEQGAGEWKISGKAKGERRKSYKNTENLATFDVDIKIESITSKVLNKLKQLINIDNYRRGKS